MGGIWGQARYLGAGFFTPTSPSACQPVETDWDQPLPQKGDRHGVSPCAGNRTLDRRTWPSARWSVEAGCGTQICGQTRCPVCRSGTFNVKRSTPNVQWGDRKGAWWAGYGDRHGVWGPAEQIEGQARYSGDRAFDTSEQTQRPVERSNRAAAPTYGDRHDVRYTDQERSTSKVQRSTFKGLTEREHGGRDMGTDTIFGSAVVREAGQLASPTRQRFQSV